MSEGQKVVLSREESHHLHNVLRLREGAGVELIDGRGTVASATVSMSSKNAAEVSIGSVAHFSRRSAIRLCFSIAKSHSTDFLIRRCTELGVSSFQPLVTDHGLAAKAWNASRWERVVEEVCKQCQESHFPELREPLPFREWLAEEKERLIVVCDENDRAPSPVLKSGTACDLLVGAEGGWSDSERVALGKKALLLGLGANRLRAETAALVALTLVKDRLGELHPG